MYWPQSITSQSFIKIHKFFDFFFTLKVEIWPPVPINLKLLRFFFELFETSGDGSADPRNRFKIRITLRPTLYLLTSSLLSPSSIIWDPTICKPESNYDHKLVEWTFKPAKRYPLSISWDFVSPSPLGTADSDFLLKEYLKWIKELRHSLPGAILEFDCAYWWVRMGVFKVSLRSFLKLIKCKQNLPCEDSTNGLIRM